MESSQSEVGIQRMSKETMRVAKVDGTIIGEFWAEADRIIERRRKLRG